MKFPKKILGFVGANVLLLGFLSPAYAACPSGGVYSMAQAKAGMAAYNANCASCHNADMSGNSGPALAGEKFVSYLSFTKITATQLEAFIASQMPAATPGSLTNQQYIDIFAYILSYNHYPAGDKEMTVESLSCLNMLPYPGKG